MSSYYESQGGGGDVMSFRETVLSGRPRTGRRQFVQPKPQTALVIGSETLAADPAPDRRLSYRPIAGAPGGKDHLSREGGSIVARHDLPVESSPSADHAASAMSPRGKALAARRSMTHHAGGPDHIRFDSHDNVVYTCGVKEAQMRLALEPELRASAEQAIGAGARVPAYELGDRRKPAGYSSDTPQHNMGGPDHIPSIWADPVGPAAYKESVSEAQAKLAHDPAVRQDAERIEMAGRRVEPKWLGESIRTTRPIGGQSSFALSWDDRGASHSSASSSSTSDLTEKARILRPEHTVGGRSGQYLDGASTRDNGAGRPATAAGGDSGARPMSRGYQNSNGVGSIFGGSSWEDPARLRTIHAPADVRQGSTGSSGSGSSGSPAVSRLKREQPLGGRGHSGVNLEEVGTRRLDDGSSFSRGGASAAYHNRSSIVF